MNTPAPHIPAAHTPAAALPFPPIPTLQARDGALWLEGLALAELAARFGTPTYVYSKAALEAAFASWREALAGRRALVCYAVKGQLQPRHPVGVRPPRRRLRHRLGR